jgi:hypothetical protein
VGVTSKIGDATRDLKNKTKGMGLKLVLEEAKKLDSG